MGLIVRYTVEPKAVIKAFTASQRVDSEEQAKRLKEFLSKSCIDKYSGFRLYDEHKLLKVL